MHSPPATKLLFDAVFFDIGSTLIPSADIISRAARYASAALERESLIPNAEAFLACYEQADAVINPPHISHIYSDARIIAHAETLARFAHDHRRVFFFLNAFRESLRAQMQPIPKLLELFQALAQAEVLRGIISDGSAEGQSAVLFRLVLLPLVSPRLCLISEAMGMEKCAPEFYRRALALAQVDPQRALIIGDHLERDVAVPQSIGMKAVHLRAYTPPRFILQEKQAALHAIQPDAVFDNWEDLVRWLL